MPPPEVEPSQEESSPRLVGAGLRTLARAGTLALVGMVLSAVFQFVLAVVVTRLEGAGGAGLFFESIALFMILATVGELGAHTGLVRMLPRYRALGRTADVLSTITVAVCPVMVACSGLAVVLYVIAPRLATLVFHDLRHSDAVDNLRLLAPFLPLAAGTSVALAATRGLGKISPYVVVQNVAMPAARPILVAAGVATGLGTVALPLAWALPFPFGYMAAVYITFQLAKKATSMDDPDSAPRRGFGELACEFWRYAAPRGLAAVFGTTVMWIDTLLVGALRSTAEAGVYASVSRFAVVGVYGLQAVGMAIAPHLSDLMARDRWSDVEGVYQVGTWWLIALTWPLYLIMAVFAPTLLSIFGPEFTSGDAALAILAVAMLANLGTGNVTFVLLMSGKSLWHLLNTGISVTLNVSLNLLLVPQLGINGAALAWAASILWSNLAALVEVRILLGVRPFGTGYHLVSFGTAFWYGASAVLIRWAWGPSWQALLLTITVGTAGFLPLVWRGRQVLELAVLQEAFALRRGRRAVVQNGTNGALCDDR